MILCVIYPKLLQVGENTFPVRCEVSRGRSSSVRISNGEVIIRFSRFSSEAQNLKIVERFLTWAGKRLAKFKPSSFVLPVYNDGGKVFTHNKVYDIVVKTTDRKNNAARLKDSVIEVFLGRVFSEKLSEKGRGVVVKKLAEDAILKDQTSYLKEVVDELNQMHFQEKVNVCKFKKTKSRFGSMSRKRNMNISFRLLFAPREVFRYVCVHELSHLKEFNHSKRFWAVVESAMPEYKESEKWLKHNGFMLG